MKAKRISHESIIICWLSVWL